MNQRHVLTPVEVEEIIERACKEPGIADMIALLRLSEGLTGLGTERLVVAQTSTTTGVVVRG